MDTALHLERRIYLRQSISTRLLCIHHQGATINQKPRLHRRGFFVLPGFLSRAQVQPPHGYHLGFFVACRQPENKNRHTYGRPCAGAQLSRKTYIENFHAEINIRLSHFSHIGIIHVDKTKRSWYCQLSITALPRAHGLPHNTQKGAEDGLPLQIYYNTHTPQYPVHSSSHNRNCPLSSWLRTSTSASGFRAG